MNAATLAALVGVVVIVGAGGYAAARPGPQVDATRRRRARSRAPRPADGLGHRRDRLADGFGHQRDRLVDGLGQGGAFAALISASIPPVVLLCWLPGMLAQHHPLAQVNQHLYGWFQQQGHTAPWFMQLMRAASRLAEWPETFVISGLAAAGLALAARRRRWLPPLLVATAVVLERYLQKVISDVVHPSHPPAHLGTYPSGGAARVVAVYGFVVYLLVRRTGPGRPASMAWATAVALAAFLVGYARAFLGLHWAVDVLGGWLFGGLLLLALVAAAGAFDHLPDQTPGGAHLAANRRHPDPSMRAG